MYFLYKILIYKRLATCFTACHPVSPVGGSRGKEEEKKQLYADS
jgi:hypothetical protein